MLNSDSTAPTVSLRSTLSYSFFPPSVGLVEILTGVLWFASNAFILSVCLCGAYHSKCLESVCVCLVTLGANAVTSVGIKWHHVGKNT